MREGDFMLYNDNDDVNQTNIMTWHDMIWHEVTYAGQKRNDSTKWKETKDHVDSSYVKWSYELSECWDLSVRKRRLEMVMEPNFYSEPRYGSTCESNFVPLPFYADIVWYNMVWYLLLYYSTTTYLRTNKNDISNYLRISSNLCIIISVPSINPRLNRKARKDEEEDSRGWNIF